MSNILVVVPLKSFRAAKQRLRDEGVTRPDYLMRELAEGVITAVHPRPCLVVCEDPEVAQWSLRRGAGVWLRNSLDLNDAVTSVREGVRHRADFILVVHGDLSHPEGLAQFEPSEAVTIVPDHHGRGTNVLGLHRDVDFTFEYGEDSALRHRDQAQQRGVNVDWREDTTWSFDIDTLEDLRRTQKEGGLSTPLP